MKCLTILILFLAAGLVNAQSTNPVTVAANGTPIITGNHIGDGSGLTNLFGGASPTITTNASGNMGIGGVAGLYTPANVLNTDSSFAILFSGGSAPSGTSVNILHVAYATTKTYAPIPMLTAGSAGGVSLIGANLYATNWTTTGFDLDVKGTPAIGTSNVIHVWCPPMK